MEELRFTPQGGWSLVDGKLGIAEAGAYTIGMSACEPFFVHSPKARRVALCHVDCENRLNLLGAVVTWVGGNYAHTDVKIYMEKRSDLYESIYVTTLKNVEIQRTLSQNPECGMDCDGNFIDYDALEKYAKDNYWSIPEEYRNQWHEKLDFEINPSMLGFFSFLSPHRYVCFNNFDGT